MHGAEEKNKREKFGGEGKGKRRKGVPPSSISIPRISQKNPGGTRKEEKGVPSSSSAKIEKVGVKGKRRRKKYALSLIKKCPRPGKKRGGG